MILDLARNCVVLDPAKLRPPARERTQQRGAPARDVFCCVYGVWRTWCGTPYGTTMAGGAPKEPVGGGGFASIKPDTQVVASRCIYDLSPTANHGASDRNGSRAARNRPPGQVEWPIPARPTGFGRKDGRSSLRNRPAWAIVRGRLFPDRARTNSRGRRAGSHGACAT